MSTLQLFRSFFGERDPSRLQRTFLDTLLELQKWHRGSIWIQEGAHYRCVEAVGDQCELVKGGRVPAEDDSIVGWVIENGQMTVADPKTDPRHFGAFEDALDVKSRRIWCFPLIMKSGEVYGAVQLIDIAADDSHALADAGRLERLQELVNIGADALDNAILYDRERKAKADLQSELDDIRGEPSIVGQAPVFLKAIELLETYARTDYSVMLTGESGTGKEVFARRIHCLSSRSHHSFLVQNCSAIPETLLESELFGYQKGAFSGATGNRIGLFEAANSGTLFLDEIGDMPLDIQAKILRVLQDGEIKPLGANAAIKVDVRIISATNRNLRDMIEQKTFRQDLFFRLSVLPLHLPSLRDRRDDIPLLMRHFLKREASRLGSEVKGIQPEAIKCLSRYPWPGNIRELENVIRYLLVVAEGRRIGVADFPEYIPVREADLVSKGGEQSPELPASVTYDQAETFEGLRFADMTWTAVDRAYALYLVDRYQWNLTRAAEAAGLNRSTFASRLRKMGIRRRG